MAFGSFSGTGTRSSPVRSTRSSAPNAVRIVKTPIRAPRANAFGERWVRTVRTECLDWMLVLGRRHLERVLRAYAAHYNERRPHQGLGLQTPETRPALLGARPRVPASGRTTCWADLSVNTNSQLEVRSGVCVLFTPRTGL